MKKHLISITACLALLTSCGGMMGGMGNLGDLGNTGTTGSTNGAGGLGNILQGVIGALGNQNTVNSLLDLVIGKVRITQDQLVGTWHYNEPGCAFTSEKLLSQAGGAVAAGKVKEKLQGVYSSVGIKASNTYFTFGSDNRFQAKVDGIPLSGTYTLNPDNGSIKFKATLFSFTGYVTRTTNGMALTFESKKLIQVLQTATALTGNSTIQTIGNLSKDINGVRIGFDMTR